MIEKAERSAAAHTLTGSTGDMVGARVGDTDGAALVGDSLVGVPVVGLRVTLVGAALVGLRVVTVGASVFR
jgi:hypothetical protein